jgi:putative ABC transport system ATP-binding protein
VASLELREVVKHYTSGLEVVRAVDGASLVVEPGEFVALYGPSGSGKSTLLRIAGTLMRPDRGAVWFDGNDVSLLTGRAAARHRRHNVGFVFQMFKLAAGATALENAAVKLVFDGMSLREAKEQARPWIERVGLSERAEHLPGQLSVGEQQRVAVARALVNDPRLLLVDEPTASVDARRGRAILQMLRDIGRERSIPVLLVTHDLSAAELVDRVHTLSDGRLAAGLDASVLGTTVAG